MIALPAGLWLVQCCWRPGRLGESWLGFGGRGDDIFDDGQWLLLVERVSVGGSGGG